MKYKAPFKSLKAHAENHSDVALLKKIKACLVYVLVRFREL